MTVVLRLIDTTKRAIAKSVHHCQSVTKKEGRSIAHHVTQAGIRVRLMNRYISTNVLTALKEGMQLHWVHLSVMHVRPDTTRVLTNNREHSLADHFVFHAVLACIRT